MADTKQKIEAAGLLSTLMKSLFGNIGDILNSAAEYEEEMGVLKQVTRIPLQDTSTGRTYTLTIKLSPVKDKDSLYYIEAETDAPNFDVASINARTIRLDNKTMDAFNKMIEELIAKNGLENRDDESTEDDADTAEEAEKSDMTLTQEAEINDLENDLKQELRSTQYSAVNEDGEKVYVHVDFVEDKVSSVCTLEFSVYDNAGQIMNYPKSTYECSTVDEYGNTLSFAPFYNEVGECISEYAADNGLTMDKSSLAASSIVSAKLFKASDQDEIEVRAIKASCDARKAMNVIYAVAQSDELNELLEAGSEPVAVEIVETDDGYDVNTIDEVDTSSCYCDLFKEVCIANSTLNTYQWAIGLRAWNDDPFLGSCQYPVSNFLDSCAIWVISHTDKFPTTIGAFGNDCTDLDNLKEDGNISVEKVQEATIALLTGIVEIVDIYYVNLNHEEQKVVDEFMNEVNRLLAYA